MKAVLFLILFSVSSSYGSIKLTGDAKLVACSQLFFDKVVPQLADGYLEGHLGSYQMLLPSLLRIGVRKQPAQAIMGWIDNFITTSADPIAKDMKLEIDIEHTDENRLIICFLGEDCHLKARSTRHVYIASRNFTFAGQKQDSLTAPEVKNQVSQAIVVDRPSSKAPVDALIWASGFCAELSQYAAFRVIERWIEANQKLIKQGVGPDALYQNHVSGDFPTIDEGFLRVIMISRAERSRSAFIVSVTPELGADFRSQAQKEAFKDLMALKKITAPFLRKYHIKPNNVLDFGVKWIEQMRVTIAKAE